MHLSLRLALPAVYLRCVNGHFQYFFYFYLLFYSATRVISSHLHSNLGFVLLHSPLSESFSAWVTEGHPLMSSIVTVFVLP